MGNKSDKEKCVKSMCQLFFQEVSTHKAYTAPKISSGGIKIVTDTRMDRQMDMLKAIMPPKLFQGGGI